MAFDQFVKKPIAESELVENIIQTFQASYKELKDKCFFLKLERCGIQLSHLAWFESFEDAYKLMDFYFDSAMQRACIITKYKEDHYEILCFGHFFSNNFKVWPDRVVVGREIEVSGDREKIKMIPRELLMKGFGEIEEAFAKSRRIKPM